MSKAKRPAEAQKQAKTPQGLPLCVAFVLCDKVIVGNDMSASVIRIVDTLGLPEDAPRKVGDLIEFAGLSLFISIKRGDAIGSLQLLVTSVDPTGERTPTAVVPLEREGPPESGSNVVAPVRFRWAGDGVYWFDLNAGRARIARTPVTLHVQKPPAPEAKTTKAKKPAKS